MQASLIIALILVLISCLGVVLYKAYFYLPLYELKRRARQDQTAARLYQAAAYDRSLRSWLWLVIAFCLGGAVVLGGRRLGLVVAILLAGALQLFIYNWLMQSPLSKVEAYIALGFSRPLKWLLGYIHEPFAFIADHLKPTRPTQTEVYEAEDLVRLVKDLKKRQDNRLNAAELDLVLKAASFSDKTVSQVLDKSAKLKKVVATDVVGPVLIDELHKSGLPFSLVLDTKGGEIIGTLAFSALGINSNGQVKDYMSAALYYLLEDDTLAEAFRAAALTHSPVFVVVDKKGDSLGVVTTQSLLAELLGDQKLAGGFSDFNDKQAVIERHSRAEVVE